MAMLEPHAPHEAIHSVRSFLIHIAAIAVGLLLALVLEQTVVAIHRAHQRSEIDSQMREVLSSNVKLAARNFDTLRSLHSYLLDLRTDISAHLSSSGERRQSKAADSFSHSNITLPSLAPYDAAQKDGTVAIMGADRIRLYNRLAFVRDLTLSVRAEWERAIGDFQGFQKRYVVSAGSLELGGVAKGPNLDTLSPAELNDYLARVGALIHETELLYARLDLDDTEFRALLAGARNENELFEMMNRARPQAFGLGIGEPPEK